MGHEVPNTLCDPGNSEHVLSVILEISEHDAANILCSWKYWKEARKHSLSWVVRLLVISAQQVHA